jgi:hypothetical protein
LFFALVLTGPQALGVIPPEKLSKHVMKGLVNCGKCIVSICSDQDSKVKEMSQDQKDFYSNQRRIIKAFVETLILSDNDEISVVRMHIIFTICWIFLFSFLFTVCCLIAMYPGKENITKYLFYLANEEGD